MITSQPEVRLTWSGRAVALGLLFLPTAIGGFLDARAEYRPGDLFLGRALVISALLAGTLIAVVRFVPARWLGQGPHLRRRICLALIWISVLYALIGARLLIES